MNNLGRNLALWVSIILLLLLLVNMFQPGSTQHAAQQLAYSDFIADVDTGHVRSVVMQNHNISGTLTDGTAFETYAPLDPSLVTRMVGKGVEVVAKPLEQEGSPLLRYFLNSLPIILLVAAGVGNLISTVWGRGYILNDQQTSKPSASISTLSKPRQQSQSLPSLHAAHQHIVESSA